MYKFEVGDEVKVVHRTEGSLIPAGTRGKIVRRFLDRTWGNSYVLTIVGVREEITFVESELEPTKVSVTSKFNEGDMVQAIREVQIVGGDVVLAGSTGKVVPNDNCLFPGLVTVSMLDGIRVGKLTYFAPQNLKVIKQNSTSSSPNQDLEKRVSETRDDLLKNIFN